MGTELPLERLGMANPYNTHCRWEHARESAEAINLLPFVSAAPKMAIQIPKTCFTQYRLISTAWLALKGKDYMGRGGGRTKKSLQLLLLLHPSLGGRASQGTPVTTTGLSSARY